MKRNVCWLFLLLTIVATIPVFLLYRQIAHEVTQEQLFALYHDQLVPNGGNRNDTQSLHCMQFPGNMTLYPDCLEKMQWIRNGWKSHQCYASLGVDGSVCSFRRYLSLVENHCPPMDIDVGRTTTPHYAQTNTDLEHLLKVVMPSNYYMKHRLEQYWSSWEKAMQKASAKYPNSMSSRSKMNILIHLGVLTAKNIHIGEKSSSGGPLGELLQWSDLIACLFLLGHNLYISTDSATLLRHVDRFPIDTPCPPQDSRLRLDLIITDIIGLTSFKKRRNFLVHHKCRLRLVDSFGTQVEFNYKSYFNAHQLEFSMKGTKQKNPWGGHGLQLLQHWTFFPHTPDNGFLGFAIHDSDVAPLFKRGSRGPTSLVYGKEKYMWNKADTLIEVLKSLTEVHATVADVNGTESSMFSNIINHGFLNFTGITSLLRSVDIFVGLGFPFEGPAPLEAIANGAVFINPKFDPPKSRLNTEFFRDKPTLREFTSQLPYIERLGKPYVYTVDVNDTKALAEAIRSAVKEKPRPFLPEEFTPEGMLIRVNMLLSRDLCSKTSFWPPSTSLQPKVSAQEESCEKACESAGLICEPSFFPLINFAAALQSFFGCSTSKIDNSSAPHAPYNCTIQSSTLMFSCASRPPQGSHIVRLCPCRDYLPGQMALCKQCVS
ncbi:unnamed protein product [Cylicocyclus nassatus]|uniref:alpha-1,6-mannosyl-glycoprotein 6-beta-N-acetylglucosaminyltransferase n=1 Tax=Cylicocyclus nassatus TaxID=53992 RepID=A0AA36GPB4_CYLNA|nr:unnamed protein product [Cylicocyclus nassatus]